MLVRFHWSTRSPHLLFTPFLLFFSNLIFNFTYMCSLERNTIYAPYLLIFRLSEEHRSHKTQTFPDSTFCSFSHHHCRQGLSIWASNCSLANSDSRTLRWAERENVTKYLSPEKKKKLGNQKTDTGARVEQTKNKLN